MGFLLDEINKKQQPAQRPAQRIVSQPKRKKKTLLNLINEFGPKVQKVGETLTAPIFDLAKAGIETEETVRGITSGALALNRYRQLKKAGDNVGALNALRQYNQGIKKGISILGVSNEPIRGLDDPKRALGAGQVIGSVVAPQAKVAGVGIKQILGQAALKKGIPSALYFGGTALDKKDSTAGEVVKQYATGLAIGTAAGALPSLLKGGGAKTPKISDYKNPSEQVVKDFRGNPDATRKGVQATFDDVKMMERAYAEDPALATVKPPNIYREGTKYLNPELAAGRTRDIAEKLEAYSPGLGEKFTKSLNLYRQTPQSMVTRANNIIEGYAPDISPAAKSSAQRLVDALDKLPKIRSEQTAMNLLERQKRFGQAQVAAKNLVGEKSFASEKQALSGEFPKIQFESLRKSFNEQDITNFLEEIKNSPNLSYPETFSARNGFLKLFGQSGGEVPFPSELRQLERVFGSKFVETLMAKRPILEQAGERFSKIAGFLKSSMAGADLSAPGRQGIALIGRKEYWKSFAAMFKYFGNEKAYNQLRKDIVTNKWFPLAEESRLAFTDIGSILGSREEAIMSPLTEKIPLIGKLYRGSNRAYTGFLNKLRMDTFKSIMTLAEKTGQNPLKDGKIAADAARFINLATGRGTLGALEKAAVPLNATLFSPRLVASRFQILNPVEYLNYSPLVRKEALKAMLAFGSVALSVTQLARLGGADVGSDPTSADFGKIKVGKTRYDILGGFQQPIRLMSQLLAGKVTSTTTGEAITLGKKGDYKPLTRKDIIYRYFEGKEAPVASFVTQWLQGTDWKGEQFKPAQELINRLWPIAYQDVVDAVSEFGAGGFIRGIPTLFGVGAQTYPLKKDEKK